MNATSLRKIEKEVLEEGREWTRKRLQERLQAIADATEPVCAQSGLVLKRQCKTSFTLTTVSGQYASKPCAAMPAPARPGSARCVSNGD
jgi:hypothetical protein